MVLRARAKRNKATLWCYVLVLREIRLRCDVTCVCIGAECGV